MTSESGGAGLVGAGDDRMGVREGGAVCSGEGGLFSGVYVVEMANKRDSVVCADTND